MLPHPYAGLLSASSAQVPCWGAPGAEWRACICENDRVTPKGLASSLQPDSARAVRATVGSGLCGKHRPGVCPPWGAGGLGCLDPCGPASSTPEHSATHLSPSHCALMGRVSSASGATRPGR